MIETPRRVLVADDDDDIRRFVEFNLQAEGYEVDTAKDGQEAVERARELLPDVVILDVMMPRLDGLQACERLRNDPRTRNISVIMLTSRALPADRVVGLTAGADDYIIKPFDVTELLARVQSTLRRARQMRGVNPLTQLAGNVEIQDELAARLKREEPVAVMYLDLDNFKAFNDYYGFFKGDEAIKLLASCTLNAVQARAGDNGFVGHIGGDDFVAVVDPSIAEELAQEVIGCWDRDIGGLYDKADAERGYIVVKDRREQLNLFPVMTLSIGIASTDRRTFGTHWEASEVATELKKYAKREQRSSYAIDRRRGPRPSAAPDPDEVASSS